MLFIFSLSNSIREVPPRRLRAGSAYERWLYRLVRKHGGRQDGGWSFDLIHLHGKSGSLSPLKHFAYDLREIVRRQKLPGYRLVIERGLHGVERLNFTPIAVDPLTAALRRRGLATSPGEKL